MKIAMVSEHASPLAALGGADAGGQNVHVAALSAALAAAGHEVTVATRRDDPGLDEIVEHDGYQVVHVPAGPPGPLPKDELLPWMRDFGCWLGDFWAQSPPDVVHAHFWMSGIASHLAASSACVPVVQTFHALGIVKRRHQGSADTSPRQRIRLERLLATSAAAVVATSSDEVFELLRMGVERGRTVVIPCGVDLDLFTPHGPVAMPRGNRFRVLSLGRLVPRKGVDTLVSALIHAPGAELVVAGGPPDDRLVHDPEAQRLLALARRLRVQDRVRLIGPVDRPDVPALIRSADVVACTPWYEPFGIVPLEAMACARPVIASAVGGLVDTVIHGETGVLVPPRDPIAVAKALQELAAQPFTAEAMGLVARGRAETRFSWHRIAADMAGVYGSVAQDGIRERAV
jgi:D-inositol-3-phosphate glycosyltransferase